VLTFKGTARVERVESTTTAKGKDIVTLVLGVEGKYPQLVPIKCFGGLGEKARGMKPGDAVDVQGHLGGRDWQGRVYGDIIADELRVAKLAPDQEHGEPPLDREDGDVPF
jgi:hypothetical protein